MMRDPHMEALEETKRLEAVAREERRARKEHQEAATQEQLRAHRFTVGDLIEALEAYLPGDAIDYAIEAEGCDCTRTVVGVSFSIQFGDTILLETI